MAEDILQSYKIDTSQAEEGLLTIRSALTGVGKKTDEATGLIGGLIARVRALGSAAKLAIAGTVVGAFVTLIGTLTQATRKAAGFEKQLAEVGTLLDKDVTGQLERFEEGLNDIRRDLPEAKNLVGALYDAISAGVDPDNALSFVRTAAESAIAGVTDTQTAVNGLTTVLNAFNKDISEAEEVADSFFKAIEQGKTTFPELADSIGLVAPLAQSLNLSLDEVNAALATLTANGRDTSQATRELRQILNAFNSNAEKFRDLGIDITEVLSERGLQGALQDVQQATGGAAEEIQPLFGRVQAVNGVLTLATSSAEEFASNLETMEEKAGSTADALETMESTTKSAWQQFKNNMTVVLRGLGSVILPTLNTALEKTISLFQDLDRTRAERFLQDLRDMDEVDPSVIQQLEATVDIQKAEERLDELRERVQKETVTIGVDFSGAKPETVREDLQDVTVKQLQLQLSSVNEVIQERATRIAELESQESDLSQTQKNALDRAEKRAEALREARTELLEGISTLSQFQAAQKRVTESRERLDEALSGEAESAAEDQAPSGDSGPTLLQRLSDIENVDELDPATQKAIGDWVEALQSKLEGEIKAMQEAAGAQDVGLFGVDVEEMVSRIEEQRKRLEQGEINPAQFAEEARSIAKEYRIEIEKIIDRSVQLTMLSEEQGKRMKRGLRVARDEAQALRSEYIQRVGDLQARGEISAETAEEIAKAIESMSDEALKAAGSFDEVLKRLSETDEISEDTFSAAQDALEHLTGETEEWGKAMQDAARFVRGIGDLADQFGDLSDEAEAAIDSTATVLQNVGRLVELTESEDIDGFFDIFSSVGTGISGITSILGAAGGVASMVQAFLEDGGGLSFEQMKDLKLSIDENIDAIRENTKALLGEGQVGGDISPDTIEQAEALIKELLSVPHGGDIADKFTDTVERLLAQLGRLDIPGFKDFRPLFKELTKAVANEAGFAKEGVRTEVLKLITGKMSLEEFIEHFSGTGSDADETDIRDILKQMVGGGFKGLKDILQQVNENLGTFSDSISGAIEELKFMRQFGDTDPTENFANFMDTVIGNATGDLKELLQEASSLDISTEEGREQLSTIITEISEQLAAGDLDDLGETDPNQVENLLSELQSFTKERDGGESDFNTQAAKARIITEHQANEVVSFLQELVQLGRTQRDLLSSIIEALGGELPESAPGPEAASAPGVSMAANLRETIAAAEANGFRPPGVGGQQSMNKIVNEGRAVYNNVRIEIDGEMSAERTARKVKKYLDNYLPRG
jgi:TP901 family phage tail tape measure protein